MSRTTTLNVQSLDMLLDHLRRLRSDGLAWRKIAKEHYPDVPPGTLCSIYKGRIPKKSTIRAALRLPEIITREGARDPITGRWIKITNEPP